MAKGKAFPKELFVKFEDPGTDDEWLNASKDAGQLAEIGRIVQAGRYKLVAVVDINAVPVVTSNTAWKP